MRSIEILSDVEATKVVVAVYVYLHGYSHAIDPLRPLETRDVRVVRCLDSYIRER